MLCKLLCFTGSSFVEKKPFPCQLCQLFFRSSCSLVLPSSNLCQLSNQQSTLAPLHLAIIAKSLHNVGLLENIFALISPPAWWLIYCQQAQQQCDNVKLSQGHKYNNSASSWKLKCMQTVRQTVRPWRTLLLGYTSITHIVASTYHQHFGDWHSKGVYTLCTNSRHLLKSLLP